MLKKIMINFSCILSIMMTTISHAQSITIRLYETAKTGYGEPVGNVIAKDTPYGLLLIPNLYGLKTGPHGFHIHVYANCSNYGNAAGGHLDPQQTQKHLGPYNPYGHLGDLPVLYANKYGKAQTPLLAPRLTTSDIRHHAMMIHVNGDNYSDFPKALGGGGARFACGIDSL